MKSQHLSIIEYTMIQFNNFYVTINYVLFKYLNNKHRQFYNICWTNFMKL